jgi:heme exporter protein B
VTPGLLRASWLLARKDVVLELRSRELALSMFLFAASMLVLLHYAAPAAGPRVAVGLLWAALLLVSLLALSRAFAAERDDDLLDALVLAPIDRAAIWLSKTLVVALLLVLVELVALPLFWLLFLGGAGERAPSAWVLVTAVALGDVGLAAAGALVASLASATRQREVLLPVLFLPLSLPLVIAGVTACTAAAEGAAVAKPLALLLLYDAVVGVLAFGAYGHVITE